MRIFFIILILVCTISQSSNAQDCDPFDPYGCDEDPDNPVPIDSGVSLLIGAGALYGLKKLKERK